VSRNRGGTRASGPDARSYMFLGDVTMRAPIFGLSTTPVTAIKSELRLQLERDLLALVYRSAR